MEKLPRGDVFCVPGDFGWNDVGSWSALGELRPADAAGNVADRRRGHRSTRAATSSYGDGKRVIAAVGVEDLVDRRHRRRRAGHAARSRAQDVRDVVKRLESEARILPRSSL